MAATIRGGWQIGVALPTAVLLLFPADWPAWAFMWLLAFAIFSACKWLSWRQVPRASAPAWQHLGYLFLWPGLDARPYLTTWWLKLGYHLLTALFLSFTVIYAWAAFR